jgi:ribokinase
MTSLGPTAGTVVVVGSSNTDMTIRVPRIPRPGETVVGGDFRITGGGKGANQAVAAARAGGRVRFVTALGSDAFGDRAREAFVADGIDVDLVRRVPDTASGVALIFVDAAGENSIAVASGANAALAPADVAPLAATLGPADVVLVQLEIPLETVAATVEIARARGARVILNPAPGRMLPDSVLRGVSIVTPNQWEATQLTGILDTHTKDGLARAAAILHQSGVRDVAITRGPDGVHVSSDGAASRVRAFRVDPVDTTAAGDVFNGALAVALIEGRPLLDAVRFASAAAAVSVTRAGAQASAPRRAEIEAMLHGGVPV